MREMQRGGDFLLCEKYREQMGTGRYRMYTL